MEKDILADGTNVKTHPGGAVHRDRVLENLAEGLAHDADGAVCGRTFAPNRNATAPGELPGRKPGTHLAAGPTLTSGPGAVIFDCGTSRQGDFTHILLVSPAAKDVLGDRRANRLGDVLGTIPGIEAVQWEGIDHLHLRAPDFEHTDLLREAHVIVAQMLA